MLTVICTRYLQEGPKLCRQFLSQFRKTLVYVTVGLL